MLSTFGNFLHSKRTPRIPNMFSIRAPTVLTYFSFQDAVEACSSVILCEHSNSERGFLTGFAKKLEALLDNKVQVFVSTQDRERLVVV